MPIPKQRFKILFDRRINRYYITQYLTMHGITGWFRIAFFFSETKLEAMLFIKRNFSSYDISSIAEFK